MTGGTLCFGHSFTGLRDHGFEWLDANASATPGSARFLEANAYQHDAIAREWRDEYEALRLDVSSLAPFALDVHEKLHGPYPDVGTLDRRRLIEQALGRTADDVDVDFEHGRHHTGSVSELFRELEADGVTDLEQLRERLHESDCSDHQRDVLVTAYRHYLDLRPQLVHPQAKPRSEKLSEVATAERPLTDVLPQLDAIVVSGVVDPSTVELAVLERLAAEFPVLVLLPTPTPEDPATGIGSALDATIDAFDALGFDTERIEGERTSPLRETAQQLYQPMDGPTATGDVLSWHEAPTPDREVRHLARRLRQRLATEDSCDADDFLVLAPGLLSYREAIADAFDAYGIDHAYHVSVLLERTYAGRAVLDLIDLCDRPRSDRLASLLSNPLVAVPDIDVAAVADLQRRHYSAAIEPLLDELDGSTGEIERLLDDLAAVRDAAPDEVVPAVEDLIERVGLESTVEELAGTATVDTGYEARALSRVDRILESVHGVCTEFGPDDPLSEVATALEGVRVSPPSQATAGRVELVGLQDAPMADFEHLYVLGATAENLAGTESRPRYFQSLGEALDLFERHRTRDRDRYRFGTLLANAETVHVTTPEATIDDEPQLVSPFVDELARVTDLEPTSGLAGERRGSWEDLQRAMAGTDPGALEGALEAASGEGHVQATFATAALRGAECGAARGQRSLTDHDGQLTTAAIDNLDADLTRAPYSPSRMTTYAKCGFKYLLGTGWGFEEDDDLGPEVSPLVVGSIVHDATEEFYRGLQPSPGEPVDLRTRDRSTLERRLLDAGLNAVDAADASFDDVFSRALLRRLFAGLATAEDNPYFGPADGGDGVDVADGSGPRGTFVQFLDTELERAAEGYRPTYFEAEFGGADDVAITDRDLPVGGRVDRIDTTVDDGVAVLDYKTSSVGGARRREKQALGGIDFQLPLYMLGAPSLDSDFADRNPADVDAGYYVINDSPSIDVRPSLADRFDDVDVDAFLHEVVVDRLDELVDGIEGGAFQPALTGSETAQCEYCEFSDVCDVRHHRRYDVIEHVDDSGGAAYVPDGARPGDLEARLPRRESDE